MLTSIITTIASNVVIGWLWRRVLEVGGWLAAILPIFMAMPPEHQAVIIAILTGQGGALSVSAAIGFAVYLWSQIMSWRSTVKPQIVTPDNKRRELTEAEARAITGWDGPIEDRARR